LIFHDSLPNYDGDEAGSLHGSLSSGVWTQRHACLVRVFRGS